MQDPVALPDDRLQPARDRLGVLIADASEQEREKLRQLLENSDRNLNVVEASSVDETLQILRDDTCAIAFVDIFLRGGSGISVVDAARKDGCQPFLLMTAGTVLPDWAMIATDAVAYEFLKKPYAGEDIANAIAAYRRMNEISQVLLVDSSPNGRKVIPKILQSSRFLCQIDETDNGPEALKMCRQKPYDLALVDIGLAGMSGLEASCQLKSRFPDMGVALMLPAADTMLAGCLKHFGLNWSLLKPFFGRDVDLLMHQVYGLRRPYLMNAVVQAGKRARAS